MSLIVAAALAAACGSDSEDVLQPIPPVEQPELAALTIAINATGSIAPPSALTVTLDGGITFDVTPGTPGAPTQATVAAGSYTAKLGALPRWCATNEDEQAVTAAEGRVTSVVFTINCTGARVTTTTTGRATDGEFLLIVDGDTLGTIGDASPITQGLPAGTYQVRLGGVASNCTVTDNDRSVTVDDAAPLTVAFEVACRGGAVRIAVTTGGTHLDWDGYEANVLSGTTTPTSIAVDPLPRNGEVALGDFAAGRELTARVDGRSLNCSVTPASIAVTVPDNDTTTASFTVSCTALPAGGILLSDDAGTLARHVASLDGIVPIGTGSEAAWAPGGTAIAFVGGTSFHVAGPAGTDVRSLGGGSAPAFTPDGSRVAFLKAPSCTPSCTWPGRIELADPVTMTYGVAPLASDDGRRGIRHFDVSPNGTQVAYVLSGGRGTPDALVVSNTDGSERHVLLERNFCQPGTGCHGGIFSVRYSPDGQTLLVNAAGLQGTSTQPQGVLAVPVNGGAVRVLASPLRRGWDWSPDGTQVLLARTTGAGTSTLVTVSAVDGSGETVVYAHDHFITSAAWARE